MNAGTLLKVLAGAAVGAFVIACARVDVEKERAARAAKDTTFRWTDANRWE
jgi:hypothetical protein